MHHFMYDFYSPLDILDIAPGKNHCHIYVHFNSLIFLKLLEIEGEKNHELQI